MVGCGGGVFLLGFFFSFCSTRGCFAMICRELTQVCWLGREQGFSFSSSGQYLTVCAACRRALSTAGRRICTQPHRFPLQSSHFSGLVQFGGEKADVELIQKEGTSC